MIAQKRPAGRSGLPNLLVPWEQYRNKAVRTGKDRLLTFNDFFGKIIVSGRLDETLPLSN